MSWSETVPTVEGWYWWRETPGSVAEIVQIERSGHKPPYWYSWGPCHGQRCPDCPNADTLNLNHAADGPVEEGYEDVEPLRGGQWWSEPVALKGDVPG